MFTKEMSNSRWIDFVGTKKSSNISIFSANSTHLTKSTKIPPTNTISPKNGTKDIEDADNITELITFIFTRFSFHWFLLSSFLLVFGDTCQIWYFSRDYNDSNEIFYSTLKRQQLNWIYRKIITTIIHSDFPFTHDGNDNIFFVRISSQ